MSTPKKKYMKLKKTRIWPSVLFFVLSLFICSLLVAVEYGLFTSYVVETKYSQELKDTERIAAVISERMQQGESAQEAINQVEVEYGSDLQMAVYGPKDELLATHGEITVDIYKDEFANLGNGNVVYLDNDVIEQAKSSNAQDDSWKSKYTLGRIDALDLAMAFSSIKSPSEDDIAPAAEGDSELWDAVMEGNYWQSLPLQDDLGRVVVKCNLVIQRDDLVFGIAICAVTAIMFLIILTIQFISLISKARNNRRMQKIVTMDEVTGGNNWIGFEQRSMQILGKRANLSKAHAIVNLSVVKYQSFCLLYGVRAGEELLFGIDSMIAGMINPKTETYGHVNKADFALLLEVEPGEEGKQQTVNRVWNMIQSFAKGPVQVSDKKKGKETNPEQPSLSIQYDKLAFKAGIIFMEPPDPAAAETILRSGIDMDPFYDNAGIAKDSAKVEEGSSVACFTYDMWEQQHWEHKVEMSMQAALDNEEFLVYVQPKYNPNTNKLSGAEALVRWQSPTEGLVPPGKFIPIFEKTGFITQLDDYMISHIAKLQGEWIAQGKEVVPISVNVSRAHFANPDLAEHICKLVDEYEVPHDCIEIELTESAFFDDKNALLSTVGKLQEYGFMVSMDDFGSGYSSLNSLKDLPLNVLKLDAGFFRGDDFDTRGEIVVSEAIALAKQLNMKIVAEGIEKQEQVDFLAKQDCDMIQGYFYAKPMPAEEYAQRL